jgi:hypothetical protein
MRPRASFARLTGKMSQRNEVNAGYDVQLPASTSITGSSTNPHTSAPQPDTRLVHISSCAPVVMSLQAENDPSILEQRIPDVLVELAKICDPLHIPSMCFVLSSAIERVFAARPDKDSPINFGTRTFTCRHPNPRFKSLYITTTANLNEIRHPTALLEAQCVPEDKSLPPFQLCSLYGGRNAFRAHVDMYQLFMTYHTQYPQLADYITLLYPITAVKRGAAEMTRILEQCMQRAEQQTLTTLRDTRDVIHQLGYKVAMYGLNAQERQRYCILREQVASSALVPQPGTLSFTPSGLVVVL